MTQGRKAFGPGHAKKEATAGGEPLWRLARDLAIFDLTAYTAEKLVKEAAPGNDLNSRPLCNVACIR